MKPQVTISDGERVSADVCEGQTVLAVLEQGTRVRAFVRETYDS